MGDSQSVAALPVTFADIEAAHMAIMPHIVRTPCLKSRTLSDIVGAEVWLKFENLQFTAAYKERGALNTLLSLTDAQRKKGVIAASAGNHAQGIAYHGTRLGIPTTIVMPRYTPVVKVQQTESHGAEIILHGDNYDEAYARARELEVERGLTFVHPFDNPKVIAGQGTVAVEMLTDAPKIDTLVVPIGGGGLISGMSIAARAMRPDVEIVGVQAALYPSMAAKMKGETLPCGGDSIAEGISVKEPGIITQGIVRSLVKDILLVDESKLEQATAMLLNIEKTVVEGAGAAGLAALLAYPERFKDRVVGLPLTGGNIDTRLLANVLLRDLARAGRLARLRIRLNDRPGQLFGVARIFDDMQVNIVEVYHQRVFTNLSAKGIYADIECETRDRDHLERLIATLKDSGYEVSSVEIA